MRYKKFISICLIVVFVFVLNSCDRAGTTNADTTADFTEAAENEESSYKPMQAYVAYFSPSDARGDEHSFFLETELEFQYDYYGNTFTDENAVQEKTYRINGAEKTIFYEESDADRYFNRIYDRYRVQEDTPASDAYVIDRASGDLMFYEPWFLSEDCRGDVFSSVDQIIERASELIEPFVSEDLLEYSSSVNTYPNYGHDMYDVEWELVKEGVVVSRIRAAVAGSGKLVYLTLEEYRENAASIVLPEGTDASCKAIVEARIAEEAAACEAEGDPVNYTGYRYYMDGYLYYDDENRAYVLYTVIFEYPYYIESADFVVYLE